MFSERVAMLLKSIYAYMSSRKIKSITLSDGNLEIVYINDDVWTIMKNEIVE